MVSPRLFRLKEKTLIYRFTMKYLPGKRNCAADAFSRFPFIKAASDMGDTELDDLHAVVCAATVTTLIEDSCITMDEDAVSKAEAEDPGYQMLILKVQGNELCQCIKSHKHNIYILIHIHTLLH